MDSESRRGLFYHPMVAFDVAGVALGFVGEKSWTHEEINKNSKAEKNKKRKQKTTKIGEQTGPLITGGSLRTSTRN